jgi:tRNAThr (cytosine32-N3)-methyltransferase
MPDARPNLYARGDKTRVYFFEKDELAEMFSPNHPDAPHRFETAHLGVDRRLLMNRKRKLKMYRIWMQGIFKKPL